MEDTGGGPPLPSWSAHPSVSLGCSGPLQEQRAPFSAAQLSSRTEGDYTASEREGPRANEGTMQQARNGEG